MYTTSVININMMILRINYYVLLAIVMHIVVIITVAHPLIENFEEERLPLSSENPDDYETVSAKEKQKSEKLGNVVIGDIIITKSRISTSSGFVNKAWPNGIVPFKIHSSVSDNVERLKSVQDGISDLNANTCVGLRQATPSDRAYILITAQDSGCYSVLGYTGKEQIVNLGNGCYRKGTVIHEIIHALGFFHEISREDRDSFVRINFQNIKTGQEINFRKASEITDDVVSYFGTSYNYESIMHYSRTAFTKAINAITIESLNNPFGVGNPKNMGQRAGLTPGDMDMINQKYRLSYKCNK